MRKIFRIMILGMLFVCPMQMMAQDPNFWIFLCLGQSNMAGKGTIEAQDMDVPDNFLSLSAVNGTDGRHIGEWRKAVPPICRQDAGLGPVDYFGRALLEKAPEGTRIGVVSVAVEGCPVDYFDRAYASQAAAMSPYDWQRDILRQYDNNPYRRLVDMARIAQREGVIKGILYHQGETDAYDADWEEKVKNLYHNLREDLALDTFSVPLLVGEVVRKEYGGQCADANETINHLPYVFHNVYVVSSAGCEPCEDHLHFSSEGYRKLGRNYAEKYLERISNFLPSEGKHEEAQFVSRSVTFSLSAEFDEDNNMEVSANAPLERVDIRRKGGEVLKTHRLDGKQTAVVPLRDLTGQPLEVEFHSVGGETRTVTIE